MKRRIKAIVPTSVVFDPDTYDLLCALVERRDQSMRATIADALHALDREDQAARELDKHLEEVSK